MAGHGEVIHTTGTTATSNPLQIMDDRAWYSFTCGHCRALGNAAVLAFTFDGRYQPVARWLRCTGCGHGSYIDQMGQQFPGMRPGRDVEGLPDSVGVAYAEARRCIEVNAYTASEMMCRKLLMHIAVDKGASDGQNFKQYIDFLENNHHVTPAMKPWVDVIRSNGNIAVHEIPQSERERAMSTLVFTEHLLRNVYEMEFLAGRFAK